MWTFLTLTVIPAGYKQSRDIEEELKKCNLFWDSQHKIYEQGAETSWGCVCTKKVCVSDNEPKACSLGIYSR